MTDTIKAIQKQIVAKLEVGEDVSELSRQLAQERAKIAAEVEVSELKKIASERQKLRDAAEAVKVKVQKQNEAIDAFLKARDTLISQLQPLLEPMKELAKMQAPSWEREPGECYLFNDIGQFAAAVQGIPEGYLPADFGAHFLEMREGTQKADNKAVEAYTYLQWCVGILSNLQKGIRTLPLKSVDGLMALDNKPEIEVGNCLVCSHPERETIDNLLRQGKSLRDLESEFGVSRSTLSRHKNHIEVE